MVETAALLVGHVLPHRSVWKGEDTIALKRDKKHGYIVTVNYERRANLISNIDLVTSFDKTEYAEAVEE